MMPARAFGLVILSAASGCVTPRGYDWGRLLAHETMAPEDVAIGVDAHVRKSVEGATGAAAPRGW